MRRGVPAAIDGTGVAADAQFDLQKAGQILDNRLVWLRQRLAGLLRRSQGCEPSDCLVLLALLFGGGL